MRIPVQISRFVLVVTFPENLCHAQEWRVDVGPTLAEGAKRHNPSIGLYGFATTGQQAGACPDLVN
ncbi:protein of unknown function [Cupriavidus neocaledonicus]|uniref:Uncharacterized protein n=1 Tax=Cupriavidus neocaledonicus TaxID=1040979 RepID=A0A375H6T0_9BURK|nr:hypothetical protein CBM2605_A230162 [Cupriavidus neocaledonicus]SPD47874.1 protein of unknown function [Cupriavidus neocaledonicus]